VGTRRRQPPAAVAIGVDLGGTNLRAAAFRLAGAAPPVELAELREPVGKDRSPGTIVDRLGRIIDSLSAQLGREAAGAPVGVGVAAMLRGGDGVIALSPHLGWRDVAFGALLRARLGGGRRVVVFNDVNAATWGEYAVGAGRGARNVVAVFVGTGIGGGIVCDGRLVDGATGCAAEVGHVKVCVGPDAAPCNCGRRGCIEAYAGGTYLLARIQADLAGGAHTAAVHLAGGAAQVRPDHIDAAAGAGDAYALALWREIARRLGGVLADLVTVLNPDRLILGGGVLSRTPRLLGMTTESVRAQANPPALAGLQILAAERGDDAGILGSALLGFAP
jgi:glucokinase